MRLIDADALMRNTILNPSHVPYITRTDIEHAPTIEPKRKTGEWIIREDMYGDTEATCSGCGFTTVVDQPGNNLPMLSDLHFCPSCGADMREGQDG